MKKVSSKKPSAQIQYASLFFILFIFIAVNYIGFKKYFREDFSINRYASLSEQTLKLVKNLSEPVTIISFVAEEPDELASLIKKDVDNLLREYKYRGDGKIIVQTVHPFTGNQADQVVQKYKISRAEDVLVVVYGEQFRVLKVVDLAVMDHSGLVYGQAPQIKTFNAEAEITGAIMSMAQDKKAKVYFTAGHGELDTDSKDKDSKGISVLISRIKGQNCDVEKINLTKVEKVPDDADLLVVAGPKYPFTPDEITRLQAYLANNGRLFLLLGPRHKTGLEKLLESYGITFNDDLIVQPVVAFSAEGLAQAISLEAVGTIFATHPSIAWIRQTNTSLPIGLSRSIAIHEKSEKIKTTTPTEVTVLTQTEDKSWGETQYEDMKAETTNFDPKEDNAGPLNLAAAVDSGAVQGGQVNLKGTKIVATGASDFLTNRYIGSLQVDFFLNAMNWMLERKESLGITPKAAKEFAITITSAQKSTLALITLVVVPLLGVIAGFWIWFRRRRWSAYEK